MISRVLVPLDGSEMAESMLERIPAVVRRVDTRLTLLSAVDPRSEADFIAHALVKERARDHQKYLNRVADKLKRDDGEVATRVEIGHAADAILDVADAENSSLICLSTHGRSGMARVVYGSVTERVVGASKRPVLVVPSFDRTEPEGGVDRRVWAFKSIVVALDGSRQALQILPHVAQVSRVFGSAVTLLVVLPEDPREEVTKAVDAYFEVATKMFADAGVTVKVQMRHGDPSTEILDYAPRYDHDAIMMTTHGRSGPSRWMLGSVAAKVVRKATVPVFVVRSATDESA